jgi:hypothetical protein
MLGRSYNIKFFKAEYFDDLTSLQFKVLIESYLDSQRRELRGYKESRGDNVPVVRITNVE